MTSTIPDVTSGQKTEDELWTTYMVALARYQENWRLWREAWHTWVNSERPRDYTAVDLVQKMVDSSREFEQQALRAWENIAYPANGLRLPTRDDE